MILFALGVLTTIIVAVLFIVFLPVLWLLTGGDLDMRHWLFDGDGSLLDRWRNRQWNGIDPKRHRDESREDSSDTPPDSFLDFTH